MDSEDFGLAKSFSKAPICAIAPQFPYHKKDMEDVESQMTQTMQNELVSEGFCFKLAAGEDVRDLTNYLILLVSGLYEVFEVEGTQDD